MADQITELKEFVVHIQSMQASAEALIASGRDLPCIEKNCIRILASIKMLELNLEGIAESGYVLDANEP